MSMSADSRVRPRAWSCPRSSPLRRAMLAVTGKTSQCVSRNSSNQRATRGAGFHASPKHTSSTVMELSATRQIPCAHSRTPGSGLCLTNSLRTFVSTRKIVEDIGERIGPLVPRRDNQGVVLFLADTTELCKGISQSFALLLAAPLQELP